MTTPDEAVTAAVPPIVPLPAVDVLDESTAEIVTCVEESFVTVFPFESWIKTIGCVLKAVPEAALEDGFVEKAS